jgi:hypothetical protein
MGTGTKRVDSDDAERSPADVAVDTAAKLCAMVFLKGKVLGRFAMLLDDVPKAMGLPLAEIEAGTDWAVEHGWLHRGKNYVELLAAGIYVAKETLDLPR